MKQKAPYELGLITEAGSEWIKIEDKLHALGVYEQYKDTAKALGLKFIILLNPKGGRVRQHLIK